MNKNRRIEFASYPVINITYIMFDLYSALRNIRSALRNICSALRNICSALRNITQMPVMRKYQQAMGNNNNRQWVTITTGNG